MKKILVTGGAGYIGSHTVVELANAGYEPVIVDNFCKSEKSVLEGLEKILGREVKCYEIDCSNGDELDKVFEQEGDIEGVIHFVAYKAVGESVEKPLKYYSNNIVSLLTLIRIMRKNNVKNLVFSSSCTVYGVPDKVPIKESAEIKPANCPYGNTKQIAEEIIDDCVSSGDLGKAILLRYFNPIGAHDSSLIGELPLGEPLNLVPRITQKAVGLLDKLIVFGDDYDTSDGTCVRDYIHVVDLAKAHVSSLEFMKKYDKKLEIFNIGAGKGTSVKELIDSFEKVSGIKLDYEIGKKREGDVPEIYADSIKAANELGWKSELSLDDALGSAWKWQQRISKKD